MTPTIVIPVETRNPGAYLAACGVVEIVGVFDPGSLSVWRRHAVSFGSASLSASACIVQTDIRESDLAAAIHKGLSDREGWEARILDGCRVPLGTVGKDDSLASVSVTIRLGDRSEEFTIDHWYHRLARADDPKIKKALGDGKSAWKFWGGQVRLPSLLLGLIESLAHGADHVPETGLAITGLLSQQAMVGSSLNLDAAARHGALDRGFSPNEAKGAVGDTAAARPAMELLAAIGLSAFFPPRRIGGTVAVARTGTAGYDGTHLTYCAWGTPAPPPLARLLARGLELPGHVASQVLAARRVEAGSKYYHRFEYARGVGSAPDDGTESEDEGEEDAGTEAG